MVSGDVSSLDIAHLEHGDGFLMDIDAPLMSEELEKAFTTTGREMDGNVKTISSWRSL